MKTDPTLQPYRRPFLHHYGAISTRTLGSSGGNADGNGAGGNPSGESPAGTAPGRGNGNRN